MIGRYPAPTMEQALRLRRIAAEEQFANWISGWRELSKSLRQAGDHAKADDALEMAHWFEYVMELALKGDR